MLPARVETRSYPYDVRRDHFGRRFIRQPERIYFPKGNQLPFHSVRQTGAAVMPWLTMLVSRAG